MVADASQDDLSDIQPGTSAAVGLTFSRASMMQYCEDSLQDNKNTELQRSMWDLVVGAQGWSHTFRNHQPSFGRYGSAIFNEESRCSNRMTVMGSR
jgi:hypothetical protein